MAFVERRQGGTAFHIMLVKDTGRNRSGLCWSGWIDLSNRAKGTLQKIMKKCGWMGRLGQVTGCLENQAEEFQAGATGKKKKKKKKPLSCS